MDHAIVIGAGMAGLLAARVLSDHAAHVTLLDRDDLPAEAEHRRGVPQDHHAHGLLARGRDVLEELFPGLTDDLVARGAQAGDLQEQVDWYNDARLLRRAPSGLRAVSMTRPLLESVVRARVTGLPAVEVLPRRDATSLVGDPGRTRVTGLRVRPRGGGAEEVIPADLVVDATGRGSATPRWLEAMGYRRAPEDRLEVGIAYTTRQYRRTPGPQPADAVVIGATTGVLRGGTALAVEDDRWLVTLFDYGGEPPPVDPAGFERFAGTLPVPALQTLVRGTEPLGSPTRTRFPASVRRRYERLDRFPAGYLVMGDAVCSLNPAFGQGMTVAAMQADALRRCLEDGTRELAPRFFHATACVVETPWKIAASAPRDPSSRERPGARARLLGAYLARVHLAAEADPAVGLAFLRVVNLLDRPERLFAPDVLARVLRPRGRRGSTRGRSLSATAPSVPATEQDPSDGSAHDGSSSARDVVLAMTDRETSGLAMDWNDQLIEQLDWHWQQQLRPRLEGLTDEEYTWEPVPGSWNVHLRGRSTAPIQAGAGDHTIDFALPEPDPPPVTTIAWRLGHVIVGVLGIRVATHFDGPVMDYQSFEYAGTAAGALRQLDEAYAAWTTGVRGLGAEGLARLCGPEEGSHADQPMAALVLHVNREVIHHGAEIAVLRDLHLRMA